MNTGTIFSVYGPLLAEGKFEKYEASRRFKLEPKCTLKNSRYFQRCRNAWQQHCWDLQLFFGGGGWGRKAPFLTISKIWYFFKFPNFPITPLLVITLKGVFVTGHNINLLFPETRFGPDPFRCFHLQSPLQGRQGSLPVRPGPLVCLQGDRFA